MLTFILAVLSQPINLSIFIEKDESTATIHTYKLAVDDLLTKYNRTLVAHGTSVRVQHLLSFAQYSNMKMFGALELLAGSDKIEERKEEIKRVLPGENVIMLVSTRLDDSLDKYNVYEVCGSVVFVNMGMVGNDALYGIFLGVVRLLGAVLSAPNMVMSEGQYKDGFVDLGSFDDVEGDKADGGSLYTRSSIRADLDHVFSQNLKGRDLLKELRECQCKYKECKEWSVNEQMDGVENVDEMLSKFKRFVGKGVAKNGKEMIAELFKFLDKDDKDTTKEAKKKKPENPAPKMSGSPVKKSFNNLLDDNVTTKPPSNDGAPTNSGDVAADTPRKNRADTASGATNNQNAGRVDVRTGTDTMNNPTNFQNVPSNTPPNISSNNPFSNPQNLLGNNFPNALLNNIYVQLQRLTDSLSQPSTQPGHLLSLNAGTLKRKKLSAFTEPYRMNDYEAAIGEKKQKYAKLS